MPVNAAGWRIEPPVSVAVAPAHRNAATAAAPIQRFGDTRHRVVRYEAVAISRFITDFPADQDLVFTRTSEAVTVSVPNSARPPSPKIVQILPTFGWRREGLVFGPMSTSLVTLMRREIETAVLFFEPRVTLDTV